MTLGIFCKIKQKSFSLHLDHKQAIANVYPFCFQVNISIIIHNYSIKYSNKHSNNLKLNIES